MRGKNGPEGVCQRGCSIPLMFDSGTCIKETGTFISKSNPFNCTSLLPIGILVLPKTLQVLFQDVPKVPFF
jgi:hypothetical protein